MVDNFYTDLEKGKRGERIAREAFASHSSDYDFIDVSNQSEYYYKGDIKAVDKKSGQEYYIEVKNDSCISYTGNVLCEEEVYYKEKGYSKPGNMYCDSDIYAVVSEPERKIYVMDFKILKANYLKGKYRYIDWPQQATVAYLLPITTVRELGGGICIIQY